MLFAYIWYLCPFVVYFQKWVNRGISIRVWWVSFCVALILGTLFEEIGIALDLWVYYGDQPFRLIGLPLWIPFDFMSFLYGIAAAVYAIVNFIPKNWIIVPATPMAMPGIHIATLLPATAALNITNNPIILYPAAMCSIVLSILFIWLMGQLLCKPNIHK